MNREGEEGEVESLHPKGVQKDVSGWQRNQG